MSARHRKARCKRCGAEGPCAPGPHDGRPYCLVCVALCDPPTARVAPCSFGRAWVVRWLSQVDDDPALLASALPVFTEEEWTEIMPARSKPDRAKAWHRRATAMIREARDRALARGRTVWRAAAPAVEEEAW